jgi:hypothetical protein
MLFFLKKNIRHLINTRLKSFIAFLFFIHHQHFSFVLRIIEFESFVIELFVCSLQFIQYCPLERRHLLEISLAVVCIA